MSCFCCKKEDETNTELIVETNKEAHDENYIINNDNKNINSNKAENNVDKYNSEEALKSIKKIQSEYRSHLFHELQQNRENLKKVHDEYKKIQLENERLKMEIEDLTSQKKELEKGATKLNEDFEKINKDNNELKQQLEKVNQKLTEINKAKNKSLVMQVSDNVINDLLDDIMMNDKEMKAKINKHIKLRYENIMGTITKIGEQKRNSIYQSYKKGKDRFNNKKTKTENLQNKNNDFSYSEKNTNNGKISDVSNANSLFDETI